MQNTLIVFLIALVFWMGSEKYQRRRQLGQKLGLRDLAAFLLR
jgi:hypothetical protein